MTILLFLLFGIALIVESSVSSLPLVALFLIIITVWCKSTHILFLAFLSGIILDILLVRNIGVTSMFFLVMIAGMVLYQKKYELRSPFFVIPFSMIASMLYVVIFPVPQPILHVIFSTILAAILFVISSLLIQKTNERQRY
jgi:cell shape-determining protein MreD